jgi:hypothetical protein
VLLRFRVINYRSLRDEQELSFVATEFNEGTARQVEVKPSGRESVLPVIGVYGANASGKSNVLSALGHLGLLVRGGLSLGLQRGRTLGWDPHVLDPETASGPTSYEAEFVAENVKYAYGIAFTDEEVLGEWLHAYPLGRRQVWFERDPADPQRLRFPDNHLGPAQTQSVLADLARPDRPFISLGGEVRHSMLEPVARWLSSLEMSTTRSRTRPLSEAIVSLFEGDQADRVVESLRRADSGIDGAEIVEVEPSEVDMAQGRTRKRREVRLRHRGRAGLTPLAFQLESDGTQAWIRLLRPLLRAMERGTVLVVDELDGSLHPELAAETIRMFHDRTLNQHGAQLLFSSHDVSMLSTVYGRPLLDRDQVWFTEKGDDGATELFPLTDLKPRKGENIERGYLSGRYGAVPGLSPGELARALWPDQPASDEAPAP